MCLFRRSAPAPFQSLLPSRGGATKPAEAAWRPGSRVRGRKVVVAAAVVLACVLVHQLVQQQRSAASERAVARIADELQVPPQWSLLSQSSKPDRLLCFSGSCPSVMRRWSVPGNVSTAVFTSTYSRAGYPLRLEHSCEPETTGQVGRRSCVASGEVDGWPVQLFLRSSDTRPGMAEVALFVG